MIGIYEKMFLIIGVVLVAVSSVMLQIDQSAFTWWMSGSLYVCAIGAFSVAFTWIRQNRKLY